MKNDNTSFITNFFAGKGKKLIIITYYIIYIIKNKNKLIVKHKTGINIF